MPNPKYAGLPGFNVDWNDTPTPSSSPPERSLVDNHELISDLARFAEGLCSESAVRKKWRLAEEVWEMLGTDDAFVRAVEEERVRRIRDGSAKRELAQAHIIRGPAVLAEIMDDPKANARHRVDSVKALDSLAANGPGAAAEQDRVRITINLGADLQAKGQEPGPSDVITIEAAARPSKQIEDDHSEDEWRR